MFPFRHKRAIGQDSEERAKALLISKGYRILGQNLTYRQGELDLVCEEVRNGRMILIFVEVRKRDPRSWVSPEASLVGTKTLRMKIACRRFLAAYRGRASEVRLDLIADDGNRLRHLQNFVPFL